MNKEFLKMRKLAGLITESQVKQISENQNDFNTIENIISQTPYPVTDLESLYDEMENTDLIDSVADAMGGDFNKARKALIAYGTAKYTSGNQNKRLDQEYYMEELNSLFDVLGNGARSYNEKTWTATERALVKGIVNILNQAGVDIS
jgi:hypothetical protein